MLVRQNLADLGALLAGCAARGKRLLVQSLKADTPSARRRLPPLLAPFDEVRRVLAGLERELLASGHGIRCPDASPPRRCASSSG